MIFRGQFIKRHYVRGYEVNGVQPLPHYYEEIYAHIKGLKAKGVRGDKHYFWYSKDGHGAAYYEATEQKKSALSTAKYFADIKNQQRYFRDVEQVINEVASWIQYIETIQFSKLSDRELRDIYNKAWQLDARVFTYYLMGQPYRLQLLEDEVRKELGKRVARSRIDYYLGRLTTSEKMTKLTEEELDRSRLILELRSSGSTIDESGRSKIVRHNDKYRVLRLGDGVWQVDEAADIEAFIRENKQPKRYYEERVREIIEAPKRIVAERDQLLDEFVFDSRTTRTLAFLREMGHVRLMTRVEGFIPFLYAINTVIDAYADRFGYTENYSNVLWLTTTETRRKRKIPAQTIRRRRGVHDEYMLLLDGKKVQWLFGAAAARKFSLLVPVLAQEVVNEVHGVMAETGTLEAAVTVYRWGDDIQKTLESIRKYPILVAGQTRPAMMPILREAKGIITDEGGVTSHAAIIARELKIPTIINTHNATKTFKTGDKVLLDANQGIVRKI